MKKIYILRHAKAVKDEEVQDFDRKLNKRGKEDVGGKIKCNHRKIK
ncbi:hypothetical protein V3K19_001410 [Campylobacter coli]|nr:hypothetical protein [Campylobacter coli]